MRMQCILVILCLGFTCIKAQKDIPNILNFCQSTISLTEHGQNSSISLALSPTPFASLYTLNLPCRIHITAPNTHLLYIRIIENTTEYSTIQNADDAQKNVELNEALFQKQLENYVNGKPVLQKQPQPIETEDSCPINVYQPALSKQPSYTTNPCADDVSSEGGLVSHQAELSFTPGSRLTSRWLLITAVGAGDVCLTSRQHSCLQAGWTPLLCISKDLVCDGVINCPTGGHLGDENPQMCKDKKSLSSTQWEKLAHDFLKKFTGKSNSGRTLLPAIQKGHNKWTDSLQSTTPPSFLGNDNTATHIPNNTNTNLSNTLAQYGPWGYLMLGMLVCGTVLTFCGLWECCCRGSKPLQQVAPPSASVSSTEVASTAVLVGNAGPPKYEELDQPPSYTVLFPEKEDV